MPRFVPHENGPIHDGQTEHKLFFPKALRIGTGPATMARKWHKSRDIVATLCHIFDRLGTTIGVSAGSAALAEPGLNQSSLHHIIKSFVPIARASDVVGTIDRAGAGPSAWAPEPLSAMTDHRRAFDTRFGVRRRIP